MGGGEAGTGGSELANVAYKNKPIVHARKNVFSQSHNCSVNTDPHSKETMK